MVTMKIFRKIKSRFVVSAILILTGFILYIAISGDNTTIGDRNSAECEKCRKNQAKSYLGADSSGIKNDTANRGTNFFVKIFSSLTSGNNEADADTILDKDPEKTKAISEINSLSKMVCNDEKLPEDIWISPKLIEKDAGLHQRELQKLLVYCKGLKSGNTTSGEKRDYYKIKLRLLEERKELIKYYLETVDGQIEDMNEKKIADMENGTEGYKGTPDEEKNNTEIEKETARFYEESIANTNKLIDQIDSVIRNYRAELAKL